VNSEAASAAWSKTGELHITARADDGSAHCCPENFDLLTYRWNSREFVQISARRVRTAPTHRKRGVGRLLVSEVLKWARGRNARVLLLSVVGNNEDAIRFYEHASYGQTKSR
jgi:GNAT superfamily N-acetyltransferase